MCIDENFDKKMKAEGKVKVSDFSSMVKKYFKNNYNIDGRFAFLYVNYEFFDENHKIFNLDLGRYVSRPEKRKVRDLLPFFLEPNTINDVRYFSLDIPGIIDINNLNFEILKRLPKGVKLIRVEEIYDILASEGYTDPIFDHYFYSMMDYPNYNLYAKPIVKSNIVKK